MKWDSVGDLQLSEKEFRVITCIIVQFSQEMHWGYDAAKDKRVFEKNFFNKFGFSLNEVDYIEYELWGIRKNIEVNQGKEIYISFFNEVLPNKPIIIYTALNECSKNYEDYEIFTIMGIYKQELDDVLVEFKEKVIDKKTELLQ